MEVIQEHYKMSSDLKGKTYLGLDINWDYDNCTVHLLMLGYVAEALTRLCYKHPRKPQDQPYPQINTYYGVKAQYAEATDNSPPLRKEHNFFFRKSRVPSCNMQG